MKIIILLLLLSGYSLVVSAQQKRLDSIINIAKADAKKHKIGRAEFKDFRTDRGNFNAIYFSPDSSTTSDLRLLKDSTYVRTFRTAMYKKTRTRRTTGHYLLIGGAIYTAASFVAAMVIIIALANGFN